MSKKKKTKENNGRKFFDFGSGSKADSLNYLGVLKVFAISVVLAGLAGSFYFLERYVNASPKVLHSVARLKLDKPVWASNELLEKIKDAASLSEDFIIDDNLAPTVARNLASIAWLQDTQVRIAGDSIVVSANWRKPVARYNGANRQVYIASDLTVLDYVPLKSTSIVELKGIESSQAPDVGKIWDRPDVTAAVEVLRLLDKMDQLTGQKPLLNQIAAIDVSNLGGRKSSTEPHIVLIAKDGTNIKWGAAVGTSQRYVEAADQEKLAMLYDFYKLNPALQNIKYVELRYPQKAVPQPSVQ